LGHPKNKELTGELREKSTEWKKIVIEWQLRIWSSEYQE